MRFDLIGRSPEDVDVAASGFSAGNSRSEMFVGVGKPAVMLFFESVDR
jgi:hypothetical protein